MIEAISLHKRYGPVAAVSDVSFRVERGEVAAFLGPNGAGKTTCMRILTGFLPATRGRCEVAGYDVAREPRMVRRVLGYLPENVPLYGDMRVREYLEFRARLKGVPARERRARIEGVLDRCALVPMRQRLVRNLSKGYRQRVGLADALVSDPKVLILDEPTVGLDPNQAMEVRGLIRDLGAERTVLLSTHILSEAEAVSSRIIIIHHGRILVTETPADLRRRVAWQRPVVVEAIGEDAEVMRGELQRLAGVERAVIGEGKPGAEGWGRYALHCRGAADPREAVFELARTRNWHLRELHLEELTLEQIFRTVTAEEGATNDA